LPYSHLGAFESTKIHGSGCDVLGTTRHVDYWREDLEMLHNSGISDLRYPVPWHRVERRPGQWNWEWLDGPMHAIYELGLSPILDPLHHVSFPDWLEDGFLNPEFPALYCRFLMELARRYEWADRYTVFNEPLATTVLCSQTGTWYPHHRSDFHLVRTAANVARAISMAMAQLRAFNDGVQFFHVETCEHHRAIDRKAENWVGHLNQRRFLFHDLVLGRVDRFHPLLPYLIEHGWRDDERQWQQDNQVPFNVLGLDYYAHSEMDWIWNAKSHRPLFRFPCERPRGFTAVATDYVQRYPVPILLSETNLAGTVADRLTWLKFMEEQCETLAERTDFRGFCWFPSIDATDWCSFCTQAEGKLTPTGIWYMDNDCHIRHRSELSYWYTRLARGEASSADLPAYRFGPPLDEHLRGYLRLMKHSTAMQDPAVPVAITGA
jgi:beta-glucosidase/6-phospho-beta-glucosidase/beta-galactosidase